MSAGCSVSGLRYSARSWPLALLLFLNACASTPRIVDSRFGTEVFSSRDGQLRYRLPVGWIDATADAPSADNLVWLVRDDYAAMLVLRQVTIDEATRRQISATGLGSLGDLLLSLSSSESGATIVKKPECSNLNGFSACTYEYVAGHPGDRVHIVLVDTGNRVFEVSTRAAASIPEESSQEIIGLQEAFVRNSEW